MSKQDVINLFKHKVDVADTEKVGVDTFFLVRSGLFFMSIILLIIASVQRSQTLFVATTITFSVYLLTELVVVKQEMKRISAK